MYNNNERIIITRDEYRNLKRHPSVLYSEFSPNMKTSYWKEPEQPELHIDKIISDSELELMILVIGYDVRRKRLDAPTFAKWSRANPDLYLKFCDIIFDDDNPFLKEVQLACREYIKQNIPSAKDLSL